MTEQKQERICFVISPIGEEGTEIRDRADKVFKHIIAPVAKEHGYLAARADHIDKPGTITRQVIDQILNAPLIVADLTGPNPNVLYELAVCHCFKRPVVQLIRDGETLPFDIADQRTIRVNHQDLDSVDKAKQRLSKQIEAVEKDAEDVDNPVSISIQLQEAKQSAKPNDTAILQVLGLIQDIREDQKRILSNLELRRSEIPSEPPGISAYKKLMASREDRLRAMLTDRLVEARKQKGEPLGLITAAQIDGTVSKIVKWLNEQGSKEPPDIDVSDP
ncbi:MAG: hypothetical protein KIT40_01815 [Nitrospira sp.]|nr:hypothetical protein [Nitrospira sp.]